MIVKGHKIADIAEVTKRYSDSLTYLKGLANKLDYYTGHIG